MLKSFWDFCAPFYDIAEKVNGKAYAEMLKIVRDIIPQGSSVLEAACGTGAISIAIDKVANQILCTDISEKMLNIARRKVKKRNMQNIKVKNRNIFDLCEADSSFDVVIAGQVLHLIDNPEKAAAELKRVAKSMIILPMSFTENLRGMAKLGINFYRLFGFSPKVEFTAETYKEFLRSIGFDGCEYTQIDGRVPMAIAVWKK